MQMSVVMSRPFFSAMNEITRLFITFLLFSNEVKLPPQSRPLIFVYLYTRTHYKPIQKQIVEYDIKSEYLEEYSAVDRVRREKLLARKSCFV